MREKGPLARFQRELEKPDFQEDPAQLAVIERLDELWCELQRDSSWLERLRHRFGGPEPVRGVYLWGGVGRGKTWLMDLFVQCLPQGIGLRRHFHRFMGHVHQRLTELGEIANPLEVVAGEMASSSRVLCFDEFFVSDIGDAMILGTLLRHLFENGVTLVATSNVPPDELYKDGLQRARFLPAIQSILANTDVMHLDSPTDYRLRILRQAEIFHSPLDAEADRNLQSYFDAIAPGEATGDTDIRVNGRVLSTVRRARGIVWFSFRELCTTARSAADYVEIARRYNTVIVEGVPVMDDNDSNAVRRFINLVDEFYDRNVKTILSAEAPVSELYRGTRLSFEFRRTESRLIEMQSESYLARQHLP